MPGAVILVLQAAVDSTFGDCTFVVDGLASGLLDGQRPVTESVVVALIAATPPTLAAVLAYRKAGAAAVSAGVAAASAQTRDDARPRPAKSSGRKRPAGPRTRPRSPIT